MKTRKDFIAELAALAAVASVGGRADAAEGEKKMGESKTMVIYFSHTGENYSVGTITTGNTAVVAGLIAKKLGAPTWEIREETPYPVNYQACIDQAKREVSTKARPKFKGPAPDLACVETIYLGYPNWWGDAPMIVYSFLDSVKLDGKTIIPFCTHEGSGLGSTARSLAATYPKAKVQLKGFSLYGHVAQKDRAETEKKVTAWLEK